MNKRPFNARIRHKDRCRAYAMYEGERTRTSAQKAAECVVTRER